MNAKNQYNSKSNDYADNYDEDQDKKDKPKVINIQSNSWKNITNKNNT